MSVYYADTSAVIKLLIDQPQTSAMSAFYDEHEDWEWTGSTLLRIEVARAVTRVQPALLPEARELLEFFSFIPINDDVVERAMIEPDRSLRSLTPFIWQRLASWPVTSPGWSAMTSGC